MVNEPFVFELLRFDYTIIPAAAGALLIVRSLLKFMEIYKLLLYRNKLVV